MASCQEKTGHRGESADEDKAASKPVANSQPATPGEHAAHTMAPGELDPYYGLWSGGHTGEFACSACRRGARSSASRCFVPDALVGWGITNESKKIMGTKPDGSLKYTVADTHHPVASYKDGNYDGRYAWINDKINSRLARIRLDYFVCDKITELPNVQGFHGVFPDKRDPVDPTSTTRRACSAAPSSPSRCPTTARTCEKPANYATVHLRRRRDHGGALAGQIDGNWTYWRPPTTASWRRRTSTTSRTA